MSEYRSPLWASSSGALFFACLRRHLPTIICDPSSVLAVPRPPEPIKSPQEKPGRGNPISALNGNLRSFAVDSLFPNSTKMLHCSTGCYGLRGDMIAQRFPEKFVCRRRPGLGIKTGRSSHQLLDHDKRPPGDQSRAQRLSQATALGQVLFSCHYRTQQKHPTYAPRTDDEHQQHQRPATAHAVDSVVYPKGDCLPARATASPVS